MAELFIVAVCGFAVGFAAACLWLRQVTRIAERAYQLATAEMWALYEQRITGVQGTFQPEQK